MTWQERAFYGFVALALAILLALPVWGLLRHLSAADAPRGRCLQTRTFQTTQPMLVGKVTILIPTFHTICVEWEQQPENESK